MEITTACALTTHVSEIKDDSGFEVFPNPSNGNFNIRLNAPLAKGVVYVYNDLGMLVLEQNATHAIEMMDASAGIYFVKLQLREKVYMHKLVIEDGVFER